jgi:hypothetical protein
MAAGNFSAQTLRSELSTRGVLRPTRFRVDCGLPPALNGITTPLVGADLVGQARSGIVSMWCESAELPGVGLDVYPVRRYGYGAIEKKPFAPLFTDSHLVFRSDGTGFVHTFLHAWMRVAINYDHSGSIGDASGAIPNQHVYELGYKTDYMQDVSITQFDDAGTAILQVVLREAYPVYVGDVPLNWGSIDEYSRIPATFTYIGWYNAGQPRPIAQQNSANSANVVHVHP